MGTRRRCTRTSGIETAFVMASLLLAVSIVTVLRIIANRTTTICSCVFAIPTSSTTTAMTTSQYYSAAAASIYTLNTTTATITPSTVITIITTIYCLVLLLLPLLLYTAAATIATMDPTSCFLSRNLSGNREIAEVNHATAVQPLSSTGQVSRGDTTML